MGIHLSAPLARSLCASNFLSSGADPGERTSPRWGMCDLANVLLRGVGQILVPLTCGCQAEFNESAVDVYDYETQCYIQGKSQGARYSLYHYGETCYVNNGR
jgi:hypothetical protein